LAFTCSGWIQFFCRDSVLVSLSALQTISSSPIWNSTAIFIVEDDSQDGPDHVDAHQTAYVISPMH
jgi:hypothetical protein